MWVRAYPLPIDAEATRAVAALRAAWPSSRSELLRRRRDHLILRVDRADLSKNVLRGFSAFDLFLEQHPEFRERVTFIAQLMPSRTDVPEYAEYLERIEALVAVVNHRHGTPDWMPIQLKLRDDLEEAVAAYKHYDVLLVNAMFDGMNLVAKEGPLVNERDGVSILSENTGAHEELGEFALSVNPFDIQELADSIHAALTMAPGGARAAAPSGLKEIVTARDPGDWIDEQLADIREKARADGRPSASARAAVRRRRPNSAAAGPGSRPWSRPRGAAGRWTPAGGGGGRGDGSRWRAAGATALPRHRGGAARRAAAARGRCRGVAPVARRLAAGAPRRGRCAPRRARPGAAAAAASDRDRGVGGGRRGGAAAPGAARRRPAARAPTSAASAGDVAPADPAQQPSGPMARARRRGAVRVRPLLSSRRRPSMATSHGRTDPSTTSSCCSTRAHAEDQREKILADVERDLDRGGDDRQQARLGPARPWPTRSATSTTPSTTCSSSTGRPSCWRARAHAAHHRRGRALPDHQARARHAAAARACARAEAPSAAAGTCADAAAASARPPSLRQRPPKRPPRPTAAVRNAFAATSATKARRLRALRRVRSEPASRLAADEFRDDCSPPKGAPLMAATNINRVIITGNLTADPELRSLPSGTSVCKLRVAVQHAPQGQLDRRVGRQAQLLRRHRLGRPGRELRPLPVQGPPRRDRRPPRVARVGGPGGQASARPSTSSPTPSSSSAARATTPAAATAARLHARARTSRSTRATSPPRRGRRPGRSRPGRRRHPVLGRSGAGGAAATTGAPRRRSRPDPRPDALQLPMGAVARGVPHARASDVVPRGIRGLRGKAAQPQADAPAGQEGRPRQRPAQALPVLQGQDRAGRLQGHRDAAPLHLRARQDPLAPHHAAPAAATRTRSPRRSSARASSRCCRT